MVVARRVRDWGRFVRTGYSRNQNRERVIFCTVNKAEFVFEVAHSHIIIQHAILLINQYLVDVNAIDSILPVAYSIFYVKKQNLFTETKPQFFFCGSNSF